MARFGEPGDAAQGATARPNDLTAQDVHQWMAAPE